MVVLGSREALGGEVAAGSTSPTPSSVGRGERAAVAWGGRSLPFVC